MEKDGVKSDKGKPLLYVIFKQFPNALAGVATCSKFGHDKYELNGDWDNWRRLEDAEFRYSNALIRHTVADGEDPESGILHAAHAAWNALARLELMLQNKKSKD